MSARRLLGCTLALLLAAAPARAATPLATEAARAHYDAGSIYFQQGDARRALTEFLAAQHDDDRPALDFDIATCYERLGDPARAAAHLRRFLAREGTIPDRRELEVRLAALDARLGEVAVRLVPPDALVTLDDDPGPTTLDGGLRLGAGLHHLRATREGRRGRTVDVTVVAGQRTEVVIDLGRDEDAARRRRRALAIGLGVAGGVLLVGAAVTVGVVLGTRDSTPPYVGNVGVLTVNP